MEQSADVTLVGRSLFGGVVAALVSTVLVWFPLRDVAAFGVKIDWTGDEIGKARDMAKRPARAFATRRSHRPLPQRSQALSAWSLHLHRKHLLGCSVRKVNIASRWIHALTAQWAVDRDVAASRRCAAASCGREQRYHGDAGTDAADRSAAQLFEGVGHNAHVEAPEQVWKFVGVLGNRQVSTMSTQVVRSTEAARANTGARSRLISTSNDSMRPFLTILSDLSSASRARPHTSDAGWIVFFEPLR